MDCCGSRCFGESIWESLYRPSARWSSRGRIVGKRPFRNHFAIDKNTFSCKNFIIKSIINYPKSAQRHGEGFNPKGLWRPLLKDSLALWNLPPSRIIGNGFPKNMDWTGSYSLRWVGGKNFSRGRNFDEEFESSADPHWRRSKSEI